MELEQFGYIQYSPFYHPAISPDAQSKGAFIFNTLNKGWVSILDLV
jgi:hypothetical protein